MTALSAPRPTRSLETGFNIWRTFKVKGDEIIYPGAVVAIDADGYLVTGDALTTLRVVGIAVPTQPQMTRLKGYIDATDLSDGVMESEVQSCIALLANSSSGDQITQADVGNDCYLVDDQTVAKTSGGTMQVTEATLTFNGTDAVGLDIDGVRVQVPCNTNAATTIDDWLVEFAKYDQLKAAVTPTDGTTKIVLTFKTPGKHNVESYSPADADFTIAHTTPGVAATRSKAGKVWLVETGGVWVALGLSN